jgi:hypothetical protein
VYQTLLWLRAEDVEVDVNDAVTRWRDVSSSSSAVLPGTGYAFVPLSPEETKTAIGSVLCMHCILCL